MDNLTNHGMLDAMLLDKTAHRLKWRKYQSNLTEYERWQKWVLSTD